MKHESTTWEGIEIPASPRFEGSATADVVIIGGGIAGTSIAYRLATQGKKVIVVDKGTLRESTTARTTAFLTRSLDTDLPTLKKLFGSKTKEIIRSHETAIDTIESVVKEESIECDFARVPHYSVAFSERGARAFQKECDLSRECGFDAEMVPRTTFPFPNKGALLIPYQARFHPLNYVIGLRERATARGAQFFDRSEALSIDGDDPVTVRLQHGTITAKAAVVATYNPFVQPWWYIFKKGMYTSYVLELSIPKGAIPQALYEDDGNPYTYFRVEPSEKDPVRDRLIIGGEDHRRELPFDPDRAFNRLEHYAKKMLGIKDIRVERRWSGPILEQSDGIALIGRMDKKHPNRFVATGFSGNGMTWAMIASMMIPDLIDGKEHPWEDLYRPNRSLSLWAIVLKGRDYLQEFVNGVASLLTSSKKRKE